MRGIKQVKNYRLIKEIGRGKTWIVHEAIDDTTGNKYAIKTIPASKLENKQLMDNFKKELVHLHNAYHTNLVKIIGVEKTINNVYLVIELCNGGTLSDYLSYYKEKYKTSIPENQVQYIIRQLINCLEFMRKNNIYHRDLKLENILIHFNLKHKIEDDLYEIYNNNSIFECTIKIGDLGYLRDNDDHYNIESSICEYPMGSIINLNNKEKEIEYNSKYDIYSIGSICYELLTGISAVCLNDIKNFKTLYNHMQFYPEIIKTSLEGISFINGILQFMPESRIDWNQTISHQFIINDTSSFSNVILEKINITEDEFEKFYDEMKINKYFLWIFFASKLYRGNIDKIDSDYLLNKDYLSKQKKEKDIESSFFNNYLKFTKKQINQSNNFLNLDIKINIEKSIEKEIYSKKYEEIKDEKQELYDCCNSLNEDKIPAEDQSIKNSEIIDEKGDKQNEDRNLIIAENYDNYITEENHEFKINSESIQKFIEDENVSNSNLTKELLTVSGSCSFLANEGELWEVLSSDSINNCRNVCINVQNNDFTIMQDYFK